MELMKQIQQEVDSGAITEYNETAARIAELKSTYGTEVPDASTKDGYERAKQIAGEMTTLRTTLEKKRKEFKAPVLAFGKMIDSEAKRITSEIVEIEEPFKLAYRAIDEEKKRIKLEIEERVIYIKDMPSMAIESESSENIEAMINELSEYDVSKETFGRRVDEASALVASTLNRLSEIHAKKIEAEQEQIRIEAERAELEKLRREAEEREAAQRAAEEKAAREAEDARIAEEAAQRAIEEERARQDAERQRIEREKQEAIEREAQAKRDAELAEQRRIEAEKQAEINRIAAEEKAKREAEAAAERARLAEVARQEKEEADRIAEQERLEANKRHAAKIHNAMAEAIADECNISEETAKKVVRALARKKVPHITVSY